MQEAISLGSPAPVGPPSASKISYFSVVLFLGSL